MNHSTEKTNEKELPEFHLNLKNVNWMALKKMGKYPVLKRSYPNFDEKAQFYIKTAEVNHRIRQFSQQSSSQPKRRWNPSSRKAHLSNIVSPVKSKYFMNYENPEEKGLDRIRSEYLKERRKDKKKKLKKNGEKNGLKIEIGYKDSGEKKVKFLDQEVTKAKKLPRSVSHSEISEYRSADFQAIADAPLPFFWQIESSENHEDPNARPNAPIKKLVEFAQNTGHLDNETEYYHNNSMSILSGYKTDQLNKPCFPKNYSNLDQKVKLKLPIPQPDKYFIKKLPRRFHMKKFQSQAEDATAAETDPSLKQVDYSSISKAVLTSLEGKMSSRKRDFVKLNKEKLKEISRSRYLKKSLATNESTPGAEMRLFYEQKKKELLRISLKNQKIEKAKKGSIRSASIGNVLSFRQAAEFDEVMAASSIASMARAEKAGKMYGGSQLSSSFVGKATNKTQRSKQIKRNQSMQRSLILSGIQEQSRHFSARLDLKRRKQSGRSKKIQSGRLAREILRNSQKKVILKKLPSLAEILNMSQAPAPSPVKPAEEPKAASEADEEAELNQAGKKEKTEEEEMTLEALISKINAKGIKLTKNGKIDSKQSSAQRSPLSSANKKETASKKGKTGEDDLQDSVQQTPFSKKDSINIDASTSAFKNSSRIQSPVKKPDVKTPRTYDLAEMFKQKQDGILEYIENHKHEPESRYAGFDKKVPKLVTDQERELFRDFFNDKFLKAFLSELKRSLKDSSRRKTFYDVDIGLKMEKAYFSEKIHKIVKKKKNAGVYKYLIANIEGAIREDVLESLDELYIEIADGVVELKLDYEIFKHEARRVKQKLTRLKKMTDLRASDFWINTEGTVATEKLVGGRAINVEALVPEENNPEQKSDRSSSSKGSRSRRDGSSIYSKKGSQRKFEEIEKDEVIEDDMDEGPEVENKSIESPRSERTIDKEVNLTKNSSKSPSAEKEEDVSNKEDTQQNDNKTKSEAEIQKETENSRIKEASQTSSQNDINSKNAIDFMLLNLEKMVADEAIKLKDDIIALKVKFISRKRLDNLKDFMQIENIKINAMRVQRKTRWGKLRRSLLENLRLRSKLKIWLYEDRIDEIFPKVPYAMVGTRQMFAMVKMGLDDQVIREVKRNRNYLYQYDKVKDSILIRYCFFLSLLFRNHNLLPFIYFCFSVVIL